MVAIVRAINILYEAIFWLIMVRVLMSWLPVKKTGPIVEFLYMVTEPILHPARLIMFRIFPKMRNAGLDLSPIFGLLMLQLLRNAIIFLIIRL